MIAKKRERERKMDLRADPRDKTASGEIMTYSVVPVRRHGEVKVFQSAADREALLCAI